MIPKVGCRFNLNNFRPISLLGWIHKLVMGVLVARLRGVVGKLVRDMQSTFIREKNIFEGWTVALEFMDDLRCSGDGMLFKIYLEKAYDYVD